MLTVEAATGVEPRVLRPDLYASTPDAGRRRRGRCRARAGICAACRAARARAGCSAAASASRACAATRRPLGLAHAALAEAASAPASSASSANIFDLFIGLGRGELLPYGSYYLTGFLHERPLARLRARLARSASSAPKGKPSPRITPRSCARSWPGWSAALPRAGGTDRELFEKHLAPWIGRFFADLEQAEAADFYRRVGALGRVFIEIETEAFALPA